MKSWRTRIATGLAVGAAAVTVPLAATPAFAADWTLVGGFPTQSACVAEGDDYINNNSDLHDYTEFKCERTSGGSWGVYVR